MGNPVSTVRGAIWAPSKFSGSEQPFPSPASMFTFCHKLFFFEKPPEPFLRSQQFSYLARIDSKCYLTAVHTQNTTCRCVRSVWRVCLLFLEKGSRAIPKIRIFEYLHKPCADNEVDTTPVASGLMLMSTQELLTPCQSLVNGRA